MRNFGCVDLGADPATPIASWVAALLPPVIIPPIHQRQSCPASRARILNAGMELRHTAVGPPRSRANSPHPRPNGLGAWPEEVSSSPDAQPPPAAAHSSAADWGASGSPLRIDACGTSK